MPRPFLPPRGIFVHTMIVYNRELPPKVVYTWIQLRGFPGLQDCQSFEDWQSWMGMRTL